MKSKMFKSVKHSKRITGSGKLIHSSFDFNSSRQLIMSRPTPENLDFLQELTDAISMGDDNVWRMWR